MECPRCGLANPATAIRCDCGYDFRSGRMSGQPATGDRTGTGQFISAESLARWTVGLLIAGICLDVVAIVSGLLQASLVTQILTGATITDAEAASNDSRQQLIGVLQIILY